MGIISANKTASKKIINGKETFDVTLSLESEPDIRDNPKDIGLILDRSSSMSGQTLISMKEGACHFIDVISISTQGSPGKSIGGNSKIGVSSFANTADIDQILTNSVIGLKKAVNDLVASGTTNHDAAFEKGIDLLNGSTKDKVLVLFTDGKSNAGSEGYDVAERAKAMGIEIYCIGFGAAQTIDMQALEKWASVPTADHILVTPNYQEIENMFELLADRISGPKATGIVMTDHVNKCFDVVSIVQQSKGVASITGKHSVRWNIDALGERTKEKATLTFKVRDNGTCSGEVPVNESYDYRDNELNTISLPAPTITIVNTSLYVYEDCPSAFDINAEGCNDYITYDAGDITLDNVGRVVQVSANLKDVCPDKQVALAVILTELDATGKEHNRGMKTLLIPAHNEPACMDVKVNCIKFVVPEVTDMMGSPTAMCNDRQFKVRFIANYLDTGYYCCSDI